MARTLAMFTDVSLCIGCRACQVACKQWNQLAPEEPEWTGTYQNHAHFTDKSYRLVRFFEETDDKGQIKQWQDRKSTRLNSSHLVISYAVFCLKKKKKIPLLQRYSCSQF